MDSTLREDVSFGSGQDTIVAWWYPGGPGRRSCVVMSPGGGGTKRCGHEVFAERFAADGHHVLVIDYRHFGDSGGEPRELANPHRQIEDIQASIGYARSRDDVDPDRVALWGFSLSGGSVLVAAVHDQRVAAVISEVPLLDGLNGLARSMTQPGQSPVSLAKTTGRVAADLTAAALGREPAHLPLVGPPGSSALMTSADAEPGYRRIAGPDWVNAVCARAVVSLSRFRPVTMADRVPCPWLVQIGQRDVIASTAVAEKAARRAGARATVRRYDSGHFDILVGDAFELAVTDQTTFLREHLTPTTAPA